MDQAQRASRVVVRSWRRVDPPAWPFVWRGLLPVLGLLALLLFAVTRFAHGWIEDAVRGRTRAALDAAGLSSAGLAVSGQQVHVTGDPKARPPQTMEALRGAGLGARCPTWAGDLRCAVQVTASVTTTAPEPPPPEPRAAVREAARRCEEGLAELLSRSTLEFRTGSAVLAPTAGPLLDQVAARARDCPGTLRIEGHTDSVGPPDKNLALSRARAGAVREALASRGLPAARLVAEGFGESRPLASNADAAGRAKNRRIELHVVAP